MRLWEAEVTVDGPLARRLLDQFPDLEVQSLRPIAEGWDRAVWLVNDEWVFGFPRREIVVPGLEREIRWLPLLAPLLPLPIPQPAFVGRPADGFPWPFFGSRFLPGREVVEAPLDDDGRSEVMLELAGFLRRLHSSEVARAVGADGLPHDANQRADMGRRVEITRDDLAEVERLGVWRAPPAVARILDEAERLAPSSRSLVVAHGDLHFRHVLVAGGRASAVIDWIDLCRADPAIDLQLVWSFLPPDRRDAFLDAYGTVEADQLLRARVIALSLGAALARYGRAEGVTAIEREAVAGLERTATD
jgi:aminoglycoside phosphotransferase (APT) family kinase protein